MSEYMSSSLWSEEPMTSIPVLSQNKRMTISIIDYFVSKMWGEETLLYFTPFPQGDLLESHASDKLLIKLIK